MTDGFSKFTAPGPTEELHQHSERPLAVGRNPEDGLPQHLQETSLEDSYVPPLQVDNLVCMADESSFVLRDYVTGKVKKSFKPNQVLLLPNGAHVVDGIESMVIVEPLRPQCQHYVRQLVDIQGNRDNTMMRRQCTAFKTEEGEYESLSNACVFACEHRVPRDFVSEERLRKFDTEKLRQGRERIEAKEEFDVERALQAEADALASGGILK